ncbi:alpha/beta fold hydrolase [Citricoccus sp. GCM10030269]|uniref:alpha/beta fold hydrolase n=1 Tax=Citricoccus sp. GCM10030269 TaxID=3273388 RepID=UPI00361569CB
MRTIESAGARLVVDEFGERNEPTVLLIAGATQSMDWWPPDFCSVLAAGGLHVVRYDQRDTGQSTTSPPESPGYSGTDLATDPLRILDELGIDAAHLVGLSMGGGIAQHVAVHCPGRVRTLTLIESSPAGGDAGELPPPDARLREAESALPEVVDWADTQAVIEYRVAAERPYAGTLGFDEKRCRAIAAVEAGRSQNMESSMSNHFVVTAASDVNPSRIVAPTLVVHSDADPLFPLAHGEALVRLIPDAALLRVRGMGHETPPPPVWATVVPVLVDHIRANDGPYAGPEGEGK